MRKIVLQKMYKLFPFNLVRDCNVPSAHKDIRISCVVNFYGRLDLLQGILYCLAAQQYPRDRFEVILVEDKGGTTAGKALALSFMDQLPVVYLALDNNYGKMGYSRNFGLARSRGEIILFLDDDTVLLQDDFLTILDRTFQMNNTVDAVVPHGHASFSCINDRYDFHDPHFMTSRCTAYRREVLQELGGFINDFVGQEDVELVIRFTIAGHQSLDTEALHFYHPPLLVPNTRKPRAVGFSFFGLKNLYSWPIWLILQVNCARHAPLFFLLGRRFKEQGRFGIGFLAGILDGIRGSKEQVYG